MLVAICNSMRELKSYCWQQKPDSGRNSIAPTAHLAVLSRSLPVPRQVGYERADAATVTDKEHEVMTNDQEATDKLPSIQKQLSCWLDSPVYKHGQRAVDSIQHPRLSGVCLPSTCSS